MTTLNLRYYLHQEGEDSKQLLGAEQLDSIGETLIPDYSDGGHKVSITKFFNGIECHRWLVKDLVHDSASETSVFLAAWKDSGNEEFLSQTRKAKRNVISSLQFGTLVEVDFGFIPKVKKSNGSVRTNKRYPDSIHHGEIHKRRLCVVVKADPSRVQVVPLTSKEPGSDGDLSICPISDQSLSTLAGYSSSAVQSYAICRMIKTVAISRILPPLARQGKTRSLYRDVRYVKRLAKRDKNAFKAALSHAVGLGDYEDVKKKLGESAKETIELESSNQRLEELLEEKEASRKELRERNEVLMEILVDKFREGQHDSTEAVKARIERDIVSYKAILNQA